MASLLPVSCSSKDIGIVSETLSFIHSDPSSFGAFKKMCTVHERKML